MVSPNEQEIVIADFKGGLNTSAPPSKIADNELSFAENIEIDDSGGIKNRVKAYQYDLTREHSVSGQLVIRDILEFYGSYFSGEREVFVIRAYASENAVNVGPFVYVVTADPEYVDGWRRTAVTVSAAKRKMLEFNNKAYILGTQSINVIEEIDVTTAGNLTATVTAGPASPKLIEGIFFKDRLFGVTSRSQRVYYSDIATPLTFGGSNFFDVEGSDASPVVAFEVLYDNLFIFKQNSVWQLSADGLPAEWVLRRIDTNIGALGYGSIINVDSVIYFMSKEGIFSFDGVNFTNIGSKVFDAIRDTGLIANTTANPDFLDFHQPKKHQVTKFNENIIFSIQRSWPDQDALEADINLNRPPRIYLVYNRTHGCWVNWEFVNNYYWWGPDPETIDPSEIDGSCADDFFSISGSIYARDSVFFRQPSAIVEDYFGVSAPTPETGPKNRLYRFVYEDTTDTEELVVSWEFQTKHYDFGYPGRLKRNKFNTLSFSGEAGYAFDFEMYSDLVPDPSTPVVQHTVNEVLSAGIFQECKHKLEGIGKFISMVIRLDSIEHERIQINSICINVEQDARISNHSGVA